MDIAALILWIFTAGAGIHLLITGRPDRTGPDGAAVTPAPARVRASAGVPAAAVEALASGARVPPITHTRVSTPPGQHPLLEFMHPALGVIGLGCWLAFTITHYATFAWVASGLVVATISAGLTWFAIRSRAHRPAPGRPAPARPGGSADGSAARRLPPRRFLIHGGGAALTLILAVISALAAHHT